jgi:putative membrane protein
LTVRTPSWLARSEPQKIKDLAVFFGVGLVLHLIPPTRPVMLFITPFALLAAGAYVLGALAPWKQPRLLGFLIGAFLFTFAAEAVGVATGLVFGEYRYGEALGPKLFGVPPLIGLVWCLVALGAVSLSLLLFRRRALALVFAPLCCVVFDVVLEQGAVFLGYWTWGNGAAVPLRNYAAWGAISFILTAVFLLLRIDVPSRLPAANVIIQFIFFFIILLFAVITGETHVYVF